MIEKLAKTRWTPGAEEDAWGHFLLVRLCFHERWFGAPCSSHSRAEISSKLRFATAKHCRMSTAM